MFSIEFYRPPIVLKRGDIRLLVMKLEISKF